MNSIVVYDVKDKDKETLFSFESDSVPPIGSELTLAENTEEPIDCRVVRHTYRVQGDKVRAIYIGVSINRSKKVTP